VTVWRTRHHLRTVIAAIAVATVAGSPADAVTGPAGPPDLCLALGAPGLATSTIDAVDQELRSGIAIRPLVFPAPVVERSADGTVTVFQVRSGAAASPGVGAEHGGTCPVAGDGWTLRVGRDLLQGSAERFLASAGLPDDVATAIDVELVPDQGLVRTTLRFEGGFGVGGTCWVDDVLSVDPATGAAHAGDELHQDLHFLAPQDACTRFRAFMPDGGAGQLAIRLVPAAPTEGIDPVRLRVGQVAVAADAITVSGTIETP